MDRIKEIISNPNAYMAAGVLAAGVAGFLGNSLGWACLVAGGAAGLLSRKVNPTAPSSAELDALVERLKARL